MLYWLNGWQEPVVLVLLVVPVARSAPSGRPARDRQAGRPHVRASLDWLSGRLKGDLKRRALLLRSRSIPPSRSMSTAVHGCWGARVHGAHGYMVVPTVRTVQAQTVHELSKAGRCCTTQVRLAEEQCHSKSAQSARSVNSQSVIDRFHRLPRFLCPLAAASALRLLVLPRLAISSTAGPRTRRQKKKHVSKGIGQGEQGEQSTQWPGWVFYLPALPCPALPSTAKC